MTIIIAVLIFILAALALLLLADTLVAAIRVRRKKRNAQRGRTHA